MINVYYRLTLCFTMFTYLVRAQRCGLYRPICNPKYTCCGFGAHAYCATAPCYSHSFSKSFTLGSGSIVGVSVAAALMLLGSIVTCVYCLCWMKRPNRRQTAVDPNVSTLPHSDYYSNQAYDIESTVYPDYPPPEYATLHVNGKELPLQPPAYTACASQSSTSLSYVTAREQP
ncbi:uncharacterized protein LOC108949334 [Ciona intestinalis]